MLLALKGSQVVQTTQDEGARPVHNWAIGIEDAAMIQAKHLARLPFIDRHGVALMPDAHAGKGSTVGTVIATDRAIVPAAVGVDIGCGMVAVRTSLKASDLPESLVAIRHGIEHAIPMGVGGARADRPAGLGDAFHARLSRILDVHPGIADRGNERASNQLGSLGSGNHFVEICIDESQDVWVMLHSGSRGIGNMIGSYFIERAKANMERFFITLPDSDLAYLPENTQDFTDYMEAMQWAQEYALMNRKVMLSEVIKVLQQHTPAFTLTNEAINVHHNYTDRENHFGRNLWITRKGAIRARKNDLGIIPGSMGQKSYIVRGKGNSESYCSCSHGAGRAMSRAAARRKFTLTDLVNQTSGVECRKDDEVLDEIPQAYKDLDVVMAAQADLIEVVHTLKAVLCCKGS
jgi:tRNA-splicing ligase RtcB